MESEVWSMIERDGINIERIYIIWWVSVEERYGTGHCGS
jgi:hypothetical protein